MLIKYFYGKIKPIPKKTERNLPLNTKSVKQFDFVLAALNYSATNIVYI